MRFVLLLVLAAVSSCRSPRPSELPTVEPWIVAVKSCRIPDGMPWYARFAQHTWIDVKAGAEDKWQRIEVASASAGVLERDITDSVARRDHRWEREVRLVQQILGDKARSVAARIHEAAKRHKDTFPAGYHAWPGPNSNTFIDELAEDIPELRFVLHHNAVGKDYPGWFEAGVTASGTGVHVDTLPLGFALGLEEGIELHFLQLTLGLALFPPRLELPFLPEIPWSSTNTSVVRPPRADHSVSIVIQEQPGLRWSRCTVQTPKGSLAIEVFDQPASWVFVEYVLDPGSKILTTPIRYVIDGNETRSTALVDLSKGAGRVIDLAEFCGNSILVEFELNSAGKLVLNVENAKR